MNKKVTYILLTAIFFAQISLYAQKKGLTDASSTTLISNVVIIDGTGTAPKKGALRFKGDAIIEVGELKTLAGEKVIDGKGMVLAPGFIDAHSHHLSDLQSKPAGLSTSNQGITTIVIGQDGGSYPMDRLAKDMREKPVVANVASYTGHSSLREEVMGEKNVLRQASQMEVDKMKTILAVGLFIISLTER